MSLLSLSQKLCQNSTEQLIRNHTQHIYSQVVVNSEKKCIGSLIIYISYKSHLLQQLLKSALTSQVCSWIFEQIVLKCRFFFPAIISDCHSKQMQIASASMADARMVLASLKCPQSLSGQWLAFCGPTRAVSSSAAVVEILLNNPMFYDY